MNRLEYHDRVVIVTGAARGIGLAYARLFASLGAHVVVNDLGVSMHGNGASALPAERAAASIVASGGSAIADSSDISTTEGAARLVETALETFDRIDALVNNAGTYRTDLFPNNQPRDARQLFDVHVLGSMYLAQACRAPMVDNGYGRMAFTTSTGALGAPTLTGYGAAKAAVVGLMRAVATVAEASGSDIKVNAVAPMANTRMMSAHQCCPSHSEVLMAGMRRFSRIFISETEGYTHDSFDITPDILRQQWDQIMDPSNSLIVTSTGTWSRRNAEAITSVPVTG